MENVKRATSKYKVIKDSSGYRYQFNCDLSNLTVYTSKVYFASSESDGLQRAWEEEGHKNFNQCHRCGRFVCDAMYNADVLECVACAPWEDPPMFCPHCGTKLQEGDTYCRDCGAKLQYGEV